MREARRAPRTVGPGAREAHAARDRTERQILGLGRAIIAGVSYARPYLSLGVILAACSVSGCIVYDPSLVGTGDAGRSDAASVDASTRDAGLDAASVDAGELDAGSLDAGERDAGALDAGERDASEPDAGPPTPTLTVLSLNLHCLSVEGTAYADNASRFAAIAATALREGVDVFALQEVCDNGTVDALTLLIEALEAESGEPWSGHAVLAHRGFVGTPDEADEHVAIVARSIRSSGELVHRRQGALRRVAATAEIGVDGGSIHVMAVHLDHLDAAVSGAQAREAAVTSLVEGDPSLALLVAGDFNAREGQPAHAALLAAGFRDRSAGVGLARIDHVFTHRASGFVTRSAQVLFDTPETRVSDHPGVLVTLVAATPEDVVVSRATAEHTPTAGRTLWIRGSSAPLSWTSGWPMVPVATGRWRFLSTEIAGPYELKAILDDSETSWQLGANVAAMAGVDLVFRPTF